MKKKLKSLLLNITIVVCVLASSFGAVCSEVNGANVNPGDTVTYEVYIGSYPRRIQGVDVSIIYDNTSLELIDDSLEFPNLSDCLVNTDIPGEIRFNSISLEGFDFSEGGLLSKVEFKAADTSAPEISLGCDIKSFLDEDKIDLKDTIASEKTIVSGGLDNLPGNGSESETDEKQESGEESENVSSGENISLVVSVVEPSDSDLKEESTVSDFISEAESEPSKIAEESEADETTDNPASAGVSRHDFTIIFMSAVGVILVIGIIFAIAARSAKKGNHFS